MSIQRFTHPRPFLFLLLLLLSLPACRESEPPAPQVLVRVNDRTISVDQFRAAFEKSLPPGQELSPEQRSDLERSFLVQLIDRELTLAEAGRLGVEVTAAELENALAEYRAEYPDGSFEELLRERGLSPEDWHREVRQGLLMEKVLSQAVDQHLAVADEEIAAYYREHREEFDRPDQVRARQIVVATEEEGRRARAQLEQGREFAAVAREFSLSPDAEEGGDLGFFGRGEMPPEFDAVVFSLKPGTVSDVVPSEYGFHLFLVEERRAARRLELDQVRDTLRRRLLEDKRERAYQAWLQDLRSRATIEMNWSLL